MDTSWVVTRNRYNLTWALIESWVATNALSMYHWNDSYKVKVIYIHKAQSTLQENSWPNYLYQSLKENILDIFWINFNIYHINYNIIIFLRYFCMTFNSIYCQILFRTPWKYEDLANIPITFVLFRILLFIYSFKCENADTNYHVQ